MSLNSKRNSNSGYFITFSTTITRCYLCWPNNCHTTKFKFRAIEWHWHNKWHFSTASNSKIFCFWRQFHFIRIIICNFWHCHSLCLFFLCCFKLKIVKNWFALSSCDLRRRHHTSLSTSAPPLRQIRHTEQNSRREIQISRRDSWR